MYVCSCVRVSVGTITAVILLRSQRNLDESKEATHNSDEFANQEFSPRHSGDMDAILNTYIDDVLIWHKRKLVITSSMYYNFVNTVKIAIEQQRKFVFTDHMKLNFQTEILSLRIRYVAIK